MANSTNFSGPVNVGPKASIRDPKAVGTTELIQVTTQNVVDDPTLEAFTVPADTTLTGMDIVIVTASDSGTSGTVKLVSDAGDIITGFDTQLVAGSFLSLHGGDGAIADVGRFLSPDTGKPTTLSLVFEEAGAAATVGEIQVRLRYIQGTEVIK